MKTTLVSLLALAVQQAASHATFQQLWVDGKDQGETCARLPLTNSPITSVTSNDIRCNAGVQAVADKCGVVAGQDVTVEMHQQPNDRSCSNEGIGGAHWGPVIVYMSKVEDASTADGSDGWFKIFEDGWEKNPSGSSGDDDFWGSKTLNSECGKVDLTIPSDIAAGDYLLRAEVIALHASGSEGGAQPYVTCYQLKVTGGGSATPETVDFPGAYKATDPGILFDIHSPVSEYIVPGPPVYSGSGSGSPAKPSSGTPSKTVSDAPAATASDKPAETVSDAPAATVSDAPAATVSDTPDAPAETVSDAPAETAPAETVAVPDKPTATAPATPTKTGSSCAKKRALRRLKAKRALKSKAKRSL